MIPDDDFLTVDQVFRTLKKAIKHKKPFSLVRVGDGENIILSQNTVLPINEVLVKSWAIEANQGIKNKGVTLPNFTLRDQMVNAIKKADIVGIPFLKNDPIKAPQDVKRPLTDKTFKYFEIRPKRICHTFVNRVLAQKVEFWRLLKGRRVLLVSDWAQRAKKILEKKPYQLNISFTCRFSHYDQMEKTIKEIIKRKDDFDIALISCGVNAVVLTQLIAEMTNKVAIDFGKSQKFIVLKKAGLKHSSILANKRMIP